MAEREMKLPPGYRKQQACATCRFALDRVDGWYCNRGNDHVPYPDWIDGEGPDYHAQFEAATAWELSHIVRSWGVCNDFEPAAPTRRETREGD